MIRRRLFNIAAWVSPALFIVGAWHWVFAQRSAISWMTHGTVAVEHVLSCDGHVIQLDNEDKLSPAQFTAALNRLNASKRVNWTPDMVEIRGWGITNFRHYCGPFTLETYTLYMDVPSISSYLPGEHDVVVGTERRVVVPLATPMLVLAILPTILGGRVIGRYLARKRQRVGRCNQCSYDLTGNTSGTCPKCGTAVPSKPEAVA